MNTYIPEGYKSLLGVYDTQKAIGLLKRLFEDQLAAKLNLFRVSAPLFLEEASGLNDNLNGYERPVLFDIPQAGKEAQVVQSLAKWKRMALHRYDFYPGKGLYTDMNAIRRDEDVLDNLHSVYVDQWDWEKIIETGDRNLDYLKSTVMDTVAAVCDTQRTMRAIYPQLQVLPELERQVTFVTAQELEDRYPDLTPKEREHAFVREHHTTFIIGIGGALRSGKPHDGRAPDYDDWALNGDILMWNPVLECAFEISSMGIRVDEESMARQLKLAGCEERRELPFHKMLLNGELPQTSLPRVEDFSAKLREIFDLGYDGVIAVMLSSGLSGTYNLARILAGECAEQGYAMKVFDSVSGALGQGMTVLQLAEDIKNGMDWEELTERRAPQLIANTYPFFSVDTLEYLVKGGRIGKVTAMAGTMLQIKPIITFAPDGQLQSVAKVRGRHQVMRKLVDMAVDRCGEHKRYNLAVAHGGAPEEMETVRQMLTEALPNSDHLWDGEIDGTLSVYIGDGVLGAAVQVLD